MAGFAIAAFDLQFVAPRGVQRVAWIRAITNQAARGLTERAIPFGNDQFVKVLAVVLKVEPKIDYNLHAHTFAPARPERPAAKQIDSGRASRFF